MEHLALAGHAGAFPLTVDAHRHLLDYLRRARDASAADPDGEETVRDVETSIGDRLRAALDGTTTVIDEQTVAQVLDDFGPVEHSSRAGTVEHAPLLCRIDEGKMIAGLCLGLATRTDVRVDWLRTIAFFLLLLTGGLLGLVYLVALLFAPRVPSVDDYRHALRRASGSLS